MTTEHRTAAFAAIIGLAASIASAQITIPIVPVGSAGNPADPTTGFGSVAYTYSIGTTEVTNAQYTAFLNAVAASDPNGLYNQSMSSASITRIGSAGSYTYATISGRENNPVNYVSFWDACRFTNWLHNGQPTGAQDNSTTENGAYTLTPSGITNNTVTRNANWQWAVTSENEWHRAAYYQPAAEGGDSDNYWLYPTSSNQMPTVFQSNSGGQNSFTTPVGSYAVNFAGVFDMGGNVQEWNETISSGSFGSPRRGVRGGSYISSVFVQQSSSRGFIHPSSENVETGFRVVAVPTPGAAALLGLGGLAATRRRRA